jgi:hypothetical protein
MADNSPQFAGFGQRYQGPPPRVNPYARPQFNGPRMAQFNPPRINNPYAQRQPYGRGPVNPYQQQNPFGRIG